MANKTLTLLTTALLVFSLYHLFIALQSNWQMTTCEPDDQNPQVQICTVHDKN